MAKICNRNSPASYPLSASTIGVIPREIRGCSQLLIFFSRGTTSFRSSPEAPVLIARRGCPIDNPLQGENQTFSLKKKFTLLYLNCELKILVLFLPTLGYTLPIQPELMEGCADFSYSEQSLHIKAEDRTIIHWPDFSLAKGEKVQYDLPSVESIVLNRVVGSNPSHIMGEIQSNGKLLLINPKGIIFDRDSQINVGSLIASTLDLHFETLTFKGKGAKVQNLGSIVAKEGSIYFLGNEVANYGTINAKQGDIGLFAANEIGLNAPSSTFISHAVTTCENYGQLFSKNASLLGDYVFLQEESVIDVSSYGMGGTVCLGGDQNRIVAERIFSHPTSCVIADSVNEGQGGNVYFLSNQDNLYFGFTSARGGTKGGNGGLIEISAANLVFEGRTDLIAPNGLAGTLILDPLDIVVDTTNVNVTAFSPFTPIGPGAQLNNATVTTALATGNVTITTVGTPLGGNGDIFVNAPILWTSNFSLTLDSARDINVNNLGDIRCQGTGNGSVSLQAVRNIVLLADVRNANSTNGAGVSGDVTVISQTGNISVGSLAQARNVSVCARKGTTTITALNGNIVVQAGSAVNAYSTIGEASQTPIGGGGPSPIASGPIIISCLGDLDVIGGSTSRCYAMIGKGGSFLNAGAVGVNRRVNATDITINVGGNLSLIGGTHLQFIGGSSTAYIANAGYQSASGPFLERNGDITLNVGGDLYVGGGRATAYIGLGSSASPGNGRCRVRANVGGNLTVACAVPPPNWGIYGFFSFGDLPLNHTMDTILNVGGNLTLDARYAVALFREFNNSSNPAIPPQTILHVGGEVNFVGGIGWATIYNEDPAFGFPANYLWEIWAGGRIRAYNGLADGTFGSPLFFTNRPGFSGNGQYDTIDIRSNEDIIQAGGLSTSRFFDSTVPATQGPISMQADYAFAPGQLWLAQSVIVNGVNIFASTPLGSDSLAFPSNGIGGVAFDMNRYDISTAVSPPGPAGLSPPLFPVIGGGPVFPVRYNFTDVLISSRDVFSDGTPADFLNIGITPGNVEFRSNISNISITGHRDVAIADNSINGAVDVLITAERDMTLTNATVFANRNIDLVVDNAFPFSPLIGPGAFSMDATSTIESNTGYIRVYTALQSLNSIDPAAEFISAGVPFFFTPGTLYEDTNQEQWCIYYPNGSLGIPFRIFYKDCLQIVLEQAETVISESLVDLHPYDEFPGWVAQFWIVNPQNNEMITSEAFYITRRQMNYFNLPKTWTRYAPTPWSYDKEELD